MITKMTKYSFILLSGEKEGFLEQLQELGVVDISRSVKPIDSDSSVMFHQAERARKTLEFLEHHRKKKLSKSRKKAQSRKRSLRRRASGTA